MKTLVREVYQTSIPSFWFVREVEETRPYAQYHIESGDYFTTLSAVLGFFEESLEHQESEEMKALQKKTVAAMRRDLNHLQRHFKIVPK